MSPPRLDAPVAVFDNYWATTLAFARSLGRRGVPLHFYGSGAGRWSRYSSGDGPCPPVERADEFLPWLLERVRSGKIDRIAPTTDLIAYYASALRDEFTAAVGRTIAPLGEIEDCLLKTRFATVSAAGDLPALTTLSPDNIKDALSSAAVLGYPLMLKPKSHLVVGFGERGRLIRSEAELSRYYRPYVVTPGQESLAETYPELCWPLLQRYLPSARHRVYSVSGIKDADGGILAASVSYKREQWPPDVGVSTVQIGCEDARILQFGLRILNRVLSRGIFEVEVLGDGIDLYAIDLNPRAFGFVELDIARGYDLPWLWYRSTLEPLRAESHVPSDVSFEARHRVMHVIRSLVRWGRPPERAVENDRRETDKPRRTVSMLGHWSDPLPMIISNCHMLRHPRSWLRSQFALARMPQVAGPI